MNPYLLASGLLGSLRRNVPVPSASRPRIHASRPLATLFAVSFFVGLPSASAAMQATMTVQISPTSQKTEGTGWSLKSYGNTTTTPGLSYLAADHYYVGDFNGDGVDEVLTVDGTTGSSSKMSVMRYDETTRKWTKLWSINGDPGDGGIYSYRGNMIVGDFDGDSKDEILGVAPD